MSTNGKIIIEGFAAHGDGPTLFYHRGAVAWALARSSEVDEVLLSQTADRHSTLAVALGVDDGEHDIVMMDESEAEPLAALTRAIDVLTDAHNRLAAMLSSQDGAQS